MQRGYLLGLAMVGVLLVPVYAWTLWNNVQQTRQDHQSSAQAGSARLAAIEERLTALEQTVKQTVQERLASPTVAGELREAATDWDARIATALEEFRRAHGLEVPVQPAAEPAKPELSTLYAQLLDPTLDWQGRSSLWAQAAEAGKLEALYELFAQAARDNPNDPQLQTRLGLACLERITHGKLTGPEAGIWGTKADRAFDAALALDERNWEARFTKAISLSNWPAFLGKQGAAIQQFQTLIAQQEAGAPEAHHAQTYYFLGNMYLQTGRKDEALAIWRQGLARHPGNEVLQAQVAQNGG